MLTSERPDRIKVAFDDPRLVANAGLLLPVTLAHRLGLGQLVDSHLDLGDAPGRAHAGDKILTLVASALAGGDCIDDADALRCGGTARVLDCTVKAPSTLGTFLRSFRWGHVRQLDRVSRELLARAWSAGAGPADGPLTIDLDSTVCETYGLGKEGARHHNYTGQRGYHPLLAVAAGTGDVLMARLRAGRANTARGAAHFLRETVSRVRHAGATGALTVRADSGFYTHDIVTVCRSNDVRFSITVRQHQRLRELIEAIQEEDWMPIPYWMEGAAAVAETTYTPFRGEPDTAPVRLIVRRVRPTPRFPTGPVCQLQLSRLHHGPGGRHPGTGSRPPPTRRDRERHPRPEVRRGTEPSALRALCRQRRLVGRSGTGSQPRPLDLPHRSGGAGGDHQDPQTTLLRPGRTTYTLGPPPHPAPSPALALGNTVRWRTDQTALPAAPCLTAVPANGTPASDSSTGQTRAPSTRAGQTGEGSPAASGPSRGCSAPLPVTLK